MAASNSKKYSVIGIFFLMVSLLFASIWLNQKSIEIYWQQTYRTNSPLKSLQQFSWWRLGPTIFDNPTHEEDSTSDIESVTSSNNNASDTHKAKKTTEASIHIEPDDINEPVQDVKKAQVQQRPDSEKKYNVLIEIPEEATTAEATTSEVINTSESTDTKTNLEEQNSQITHTIQPYSTQQNLSTAQVNKEQ
ncbi:MAG: hypothetical protein KGV50_02710, partial [Gammaproteobacteria bacterium]|nr:hypothetical protein [Gammaproteobacteria bacterium]